MRMASLLVDELHVLGQIIIRVEVMARGIEKDNGRHFCAILQLQFVDDQE